jgi:hypothetical protein
LSTCVRWMIFRVAEKAHSKPSLSAINTKAVGRYPRFTKTLHPEVCISAIVE